MARTIQEIHDEYLHTLQGEYLALGIAFDPDTLSKFDIEYLVGWVVAFCIWTMEKLFDAHTAENKELLSKEKAHTRQWYAEMAKRFQYGYALDGDTDTYDNTGLTDTQIADSKVISFASCDEFQNGLRIKVAKLIGGELAPVPNDEFTAFKAYMELVKDAGVHLKDFYINDTADSLKATIKIGYDPLVLDATGKRLDGTGNTPIQDAINNYLREGINFNGLFTTMRMTDYIQKVEGVQNVLEVSVKAKYAANPYADVGLSYKPNAGYLRFLDPNDLILQFEPSPVI